ncbi:hypothetical protein BJY04DRAFT_189472 [Aspergillus karnatakaensis]|uniref:uncharacterized protein n=1 Tax=Aspergillus karnatakaensis TaxID=1810916 RepID=UPI003CCD620D
MMLVSLRVGLCFPGRASARRDFKFRSAVDDGLDASLGAVGGRWRRRSANERRPDRWFLDGPESVELSEAPQSHRRYLATSLPYGDLRNKLVLSSSSVLSFVSNSWCLIQC